MCARRSRPTPTWATDPERRLDVWTRWGVCENVLGVHEEVFDFFRTVLEEVMDVFPSPYVHIGGDECPVTEWEHSPAALARADGRGAARAPGRCTAGSWAGSAAFLVERGPAAGRLGRDRRQLPPGFTVMTWREPGHALAAARRGHQVVHGAPPGDVSRLRPVPGPGEPPGQPGGPVALRAVHTYDRCLRAGAGGRVPGAGHPGASCGPSTCPPGARIEYLTYPRLCALADRAWSGGRGDWPDSSSGCAEHTRPAGRPGRPHRPARPAVPARPRPQLQRDPLGNSSPTVPERNTA